MGEKISEERFEDIVVEGLTDDYKFVKMTRSHSLFLVVNEIVSMTRNLYIDAVSKAGHVNKLACRGPVITTPKGESSMLQLPRCWTHQARLHETQEGAICYNTTVLASQLYDTQRC